MLRDLQRKIRDDRRKKAGRDLLPEKGVPPSAAKPRSDSPDPGVPVGNSHISDDLAAVADRHPQLYASLCQLNREQQQAVLSRDPAVMVRAQVGSGKTRVLVHKVLYLHLIQGVPLRQIAVLTFTNKAAREIRERLQMFAQVSALPSEDPLLWGTFHGVARSLLARVLPVDRLGFRPDFQVLAEDDLPPLWEAILRKHHLRVGRRSTLRQRLRGLVTSTDPKLEDLARFNVLFQAEKQARNAMDFDDLLDHATQLLGEEARPSEAGLPPAWVLVDEVQDSEPREVELLRKLVGPDTRFFAVGDPQQAIYGFRGSAPEVCQRIVEEFRCRILSLPVNYRSTGTILTAAQAVLGANANAPLTGTRSVGDPIPIRRHSEPLAEAIYLAGRFSDLASMGVAPGEVAVLYRLRSQGEILRRVLTDRGISCGEEGTPSSSSINLLTLHASKGLEFRQVFIVGANQGVLPLGFEDQPEERRLLFVGITRARDTVEISYHARPTHPQALGLPCAYLGKIPSDSVAWIDVPDTSPAPPETPAQGPSPSQGPKPWHPGQSVRHPRYGRGRVLTVTPDQVTCDFGKLGKKSFAIRLCPLFSE